MKLINKKLSLQNIIAYMYSFSIIYIIMSNFFVALGIESVFFNPNYIVLVYFFLTFLFFILILFNIAKKKRFSKIIFFSILLGVYSLCITLIVGNKAFIDAYIGTMLWGEIITISYLIGNNVANKKILFNSMIVTSGLIFYTYLVNYFQNFMRTPSFVNSIYYVLLLLPYILTIKNNLYRITGIFIIFICTLVSMKRTAIIALIIALVVFFIVNRTIINIEGQRNVDITRLIKLFLLSMTFIYIYRYIYASFDLNIFERFINLKDDGGSNRDVIYNNIWDVQNQSTITDWFFGKGHEGVYLVSGIGTSAHNDILEVLYDFGLLGLLLYLIIIINLCKKALYGIQKKIKNYDAFAASLVLFLVISMFSNLIIVPTYFFLLCQFWGIMINEMRNNE